MRRTLYATALFFIGFVPLFGQNITTKGREFWLAFMENNDTLFNYIEDGVVVNERLSVYVSSEVATSGTISIPLNGWSQNFTVAAGTTTEISIPQPNQRAHTLGSNVVRPTGIRVVTQDSVNVFAINYQKNTADATIVLPINALRHDYFVMAYKETNVSEFVILAIEDNTVITIVPPTNIYISGYGGNFPLTITLQRGQVFQAQSNGDLTGSRVYTPPGANCKPFAVFAGNRCTNVGDAPRCDHLYEQMFPVATLGKTYLSIPFRTRDADVVRVMAVENNTTVNISGQAPVNLNAGQYRDFTLSQAAYFSSDRPISLAQFSRSACTDAINQVPCANSSDNVYADPFMLMLTSMEQMVIRRATVNSFVIPNITRRFLNIATKTTNTALVRLNGAPVTGFQTVAGTPFSYVQVEVPQGNHTVVSDSGFVLYVYGFGERDSYGYSGDAVLNNFNIRVVAPDFACKNENVNFSGQSQGMAVTGWQWNFGDGTNANGQNVSHTFSQPGTYYVKLRVTANDACGADSTIKQIDVFHPTLEIVSLDSAGCGGLANGSVTVRGTGGPSPFKFSLNGGPLLQDDDNVRTFAALTAGNYQIGFEDAAGCENTFAFVMPERIQINVAITGLQNVLCHGEATGRFNAVASGASPPFSYSLNDAPFSSQNNFSGLTAGSYTLRVRDANGCERTRTVVVTQPAAPLNLAVSNLTHVLCHGRSTGGFTSSATGGTPPYTLFVNGATAPIGAFSQLSAGTYALLLRDANGCFVRDTVLVHQPPPLTATTQIFQVRCTGATDGRVVATAVGGVAPYLFALDDSTNLVADNEFTGLSVGPYRVFVRDANGCRTSVSITLDTVAVFSVATTNVVGTSCFNVSDGTLALGVVGGGVPPYEYSHDGTNFQSSATLTGLPPGAGTAVVRDSEGCLVYRPFFIPSPPPMYFTSVVVKNPSCPEGSDGLILPTAEGGTGTINYSVNATTNFTGLSQGSYLVRASDATGCFIDTLVALVHPPQLLPLYIATNVGCHGFNDGRITAQASGGTPPYTFSLSGSEFQTSGLFTDLAPGEYTLLVEDANGCAAQIPDILLTEPDALRAATVVLKHVACHGGADAQVEIFADGGTPPYLFSHGTGFDTQNLRTNLTAGEFTFTVRDANGCEFSVHDTILQPPPIEFFNVRIRDERCYESADGEIHFEAAGGTGTLSFSLNGGEFSTQTQYSLLAAGEYELTARDQSGCTRDTTLVVSQPEAIVLNVEIQAVSCHGLSDGKIFCQATGTGPFSYRLNGQSYRPSGIFTSLAGGEYVVGVRDGTGCERDFAITVPEPEALTISLAEKTNAQCKGKPGGYARVRVTGGTQPYEYRWSHKPWDGPESRELYAGDYRVVVTDAKGCKDTVNFTIAEPEYEVRAGRHLFACYLVGETSGRIEQLGPFFPSGGTWTGPGVDAATGKISVSAAPKNERYYAYYTYNGCTDSVLVQIALVDPGGEEAFCENDGIVTLRGGTPPGGVWEGPGITETARGRLNTAALGVGVHRVYYRYDPTCVGEKLVIVHPAPKADFSARPGPENVLHLPNARVELEFTGTGADGYRWDFGDDSPPVFDKNTFHVFNDEGKFNIKLTATAEPFCIDSAVKTFRVKVKPFLQEFPNAFTPNYDPVNPEWTVNVQACPSFDFKIYDRWGREVYRMETKTPVEKLSWDGLLRDGTPAPEGVYTYVFRGIFTDGGEVERKGTITLIR